MENGFVPASQVQTKVTMHTEPTTVVEHTVEETVPVGVAAMEPTVKEPSAPAAVDLPPKGAEEHQAAAPEPFVEEASVPAVVEETTHKQETFLVATPPKSQPAESTDTPVKMSLNRPRLHQKTSWIPKKPASMSKALIAEVEAAADGAVEANQGNPAGLLHKFSTHCRLCDRKKHTCAWETRAAGQRSVCSGAQCLSCSKATRHLGISRSMAALEKVPAAKAQVRLWSEYFAELKRSRVEDFCQCDLAMCKKRRAQQ